MLNDSKNNNKKNDKNIDNKTEKNKSNFNLEKSVKSPEILKKILSHLEYRNKLRLVSYNKKIQKKLKLNINDYKNESKREKIGERNGKGKEYNDGELIFEGEYLNGKRNGKGKEYYSNGSKLFEGEYLSDLKWNGIGYDPFNRKIYELKDGKGLLKEYYEDGE